MLARVQQGRSEIILCHPLRDRICGWLIPSSHVESFYFATTKDKIFLPYIHTEYFNHLAEKALYSRKCFGWWDGGTDISFLSLRSAEESSLGPVSPVFTNLKIIARVVCTRSVILHSSCTLESRNQKSQGPMLRPHPGEPDVSVAQQGLF